MSNFSSVAGNILPAVSRAAVWPCSHMDLRSRSQPAHITYIGRPCFKCIPLVQRCQKCIHGMTARLLHGDDLLFCLFIVSCCHTRNPVVSKIGFRESICKFILLFRIGRHAKLLVIFIQNPLQRKVADRIGKSVDKLLLKGCLRHQRRALSNLIDPLLKLYRLCYMVRAHHIKHTGFRLHHIRAASAGIRDRVMDPRLVTHMLPQILHARVHQFHCIQCAASLLRRTGCMGSDSVELVLGLNAGIGRTGRNLIDILRMPGQCRIQIFPDTIPRHKCLGCTALFPRTAI